MERQKLTPGNAGWVRFMASDLPVAVYLRYEDRGGRLVASEMYLEPLDDAPVSTDLLRSIPLGSIDAWVNANPAAVRDRLNLAGPDLRRAARHLARTPKTKATRQFGPVTWVDRMLRAQIPDSDEPQAKLPKVDPPEPAEPPELDATLTVPPAKPYGDDFYRAVAETYRRLAPWHRSPANLIAEDNNVPVTTAHRWIKVARDREFLEPGRRGKGA